MSNTTHVGTPMIPSTIKTLSNTHIIIHNLILTQEKNILKKKFVKPIDNHGISKNLKGANLKPIIEKKKQVEFIQTNKNKPHSNTVIIVHV